jgi:hypothetical protein
VTFSTSSRCASSESSTTSRSACECRRTRQDPPGEIRSRCRLVFLPRHAPLRGDCARSLVRGSE